MSLRCNYMRKFFTLFAGLTFLLFSMSLSAKGFADENLHYVITYKWGLIHKDAGDATLSLRNNGKDYNIMLAARTKPWADRFYQVRDTLCHTQKSRMKKGNMGKTSSNIHIRAVMSKDIALASEKTRKVIFRNPKKHSRQQDRYMTCCLYSTTCAS